MFKVIKYAEEKGIKKGMEKGKIVGIEEGIEKGVEKGKETVAKNLLSKGMDDEFVMETTGLDQSIIDKLKKVLSSGAQ